VYRIAHITPLTSAMQISIKQIGVLQSALTYIMEIAAVAMEYALHLASLLAIFEIIPHNFAFKCVQLQTRHLVLLILLETALQVFVYNNVHLDTSPKCK